MSQPSKREIDALKEIQGDDERYHGTFDDLLEARLRELDPEWIEAMLKIYRDSKMARWCA